MGVARHSDFTLQQALLFLEWKHRQEKFDAVWAHYVTQTGFLATWFGRQERIPVMLSIRGNDFDRQLFPPGDFTRLSWCLQNCQQVITVSQDLARKIEVVAGREAIVLPNSVDLDCFQPGVKDPLLIAQYGLQPDELVIGFSGELRAKKGLSFLLDAFRRLAAERAVRLLVIGEVRPGDLGEFERGLVDESVRSRVIMTGHLPDPADVARHLRLADVMVIPSLWDGMPNSVLESMAVGVPVIGSDAGAIPELIEDGVTGLLIPRSHLHQLPDKIHQLMRMDRNEVTAIIRAARSLVASNHSPAAERERLQTILEPQCRP
jgi:glycosyltransferase involved in cell wall biosynthesis